MGGAEGQGGLPREGTLKLGPGEEGGLGGAFPAEGFACGEGSEETKAASDKKLKLW